MKSKTLRDMKRYNLSEIMKGAHNMYRTGKYASFSDALRRSWKVAKFRLQVEARRAQTEAFFKAKVQEETEQAAFIARIEEEKRNRQAEESAKVEAECRAYGYNRGYHYSLFSGWGNNYCGD